jgi:hypothetical protein
MKSTRRCNKTVQTGRKSVRRSLGKGPHWPLSKLVGLEKRRLHGRRLLIEQLEPRQMLSFEPLSPLGSLIYHDLDPGEFDPNFPETHLYSVNLDANQKLSALLVPESPDIRARIAVTGPGGFSLGPIDAEAPGEWVGFQTIAVEQAGIYSIEIDRLEGAGSFELRLLLNAAIEQERGTEASNDTLATAEDIEGSFLMLPGGGQRGAAVGNLPVGSGDVDWFAFALEENQRATLLVSAWGGGSFTLDLYNTAGERLATGVAGSTKSEIDQRIDGFLATEGGTYYAAVGGTGQYALVVLRGADFELEPNDHTSTAQHISAVGVVLGALDWREVITSETEPNDSIAAANDWSGSFRPIAPNEYRAVLTGTISAGYDGDWDFFKILVSQGDSLRIDLEGSATGKGSLIDPYLRFFDSAGTELADDDDGGDGLNSLLIWSSFPWATGEYYVVADSYAGHTGTYTLTATLTTSFAGVGRDTADEYLVEANSGDELVIRTTTPGDGPGEPDNTLVPLVELFGPDDELLGGNSGGASDGRNALLMYTAVVSGTYRVRVTPVSGEGAYTLRIDGATGSRPFRVLTTGIEDGALLTSLPGSYQLVLSEGVLLTSVDPADLKLTLPDNTVVVAQAVTIIDGRTLKFFVPPLEDGESGYGDGVYGVSLAAGSLTSVSGTPLEGFEQTFILDTTGPVVASTSIADGAIVEAGPLTVHITFNEALATEELAPEDVTLVEAVSGATMNPNLISYDPETYTVALSFDELPEGNYTLTLLSSTSGFRDMVGNLLDGDGDGAPGGPFVLTFSAAAPVMPFTTPLLPLGPDGSLVYTGFQTDNFDFVGDNDAFSITLESG